MKLFLACVLSYPLMISAPALAIEKHNYLLVQAMTGQSGQPGQPRENSSAGLKESTITPDLITPGSAINSLTPMVIEKNEMSFSLENCQRNGENVTCNLQFTNVASKEQDLSLFADCSRIITDGSHEYGGLSAQIGQSSSATLSTGIAQKGFITFLGITPNTTKAQFLEIGYNTSTGGGTIRFSNVDIR